jgi:hypothetical protein
MYQGGFRKHRSTLDQVFTLREIMLNKPDLENVLLDFQAAYDMVDRRMLWKRLLMHHKVPYSTVARLRELFDFNSSILVIMGSSSTPIRNRRGLLQGSSLSPILFNFFIDEMLQELGGSNVPKVLTSGIATNCLAFADDVELHANSVEEMKPLLQICENWSIKVGMRFAPSKCIHLSATTGQYAIYGQPLSNNRTCDYLGVTFNLQDIDWESNVAKRTNKARNVTTILAQIGMNGGGFPQAASVRLYKAFIRPAMEYGIALTTLPKKLIDSLQKTQNMALRTMFGAQRNTSIKAMHKLLLLEDMTQRNQQLNIRFAARLNNSLDSTIPAVKFWWNRLPDRSRDSLITVATRNPYWEGMFKLNHLTNRLRPGQHTAAKGYADNFFKESNRNQARLLDNGLDTVAGMLQAEPGDLIRHALRPYAFSVKKTRISVTRWLLGGVAIHMPCLNCTGNNELSRKHAAVCSGAHAYLMQHYMDHYDPEGRGTILDQLLNKFRNVIPDQGFYNHLANAISLIYSNCLGFQQQANGFWTRPEPTDQDRNRSDSHNGTNATHDRPVRAIIRRTRNRQPPAQAQRPLARRNPSHGRIGRPPERERRQAQEQLSRYLASLGLDPSRQP